MAQTFNRGDYVKVQGYNLLGRVYRVHPTEYQVAIYDRRDLGTDGSPRFDFGSRHVVVKAERMSAA